MKEQQKRYMTPFQWAEVLAIIAFVMNIVGLNKAKPDEDNFKFALYAVIVGIVAYLFYTIIVARIQDVVNLLEAKATEFMDVLNEPA